MNKDFISSLRFFLAAGLLKKDNLKYFDSKIRGHISSGENILNRAQCMKEILSHLQEMYIWKDTRFIRK
ncbi:MAG: hypothetical protein N3B13_06270 [Deltaproteobacteria bacterium]|nr:hypothetical protein [Deltaproteobacteria bacterium]